MEALFSIALPSSRFVFLFHFYFFLHLFIFFVFLRGYWRAIFSGYSFFFFFYFAERGASLIWTLGVFLFLGLFVFGMDVSLFTITHVCVCAGNFQEDFLKN